jgi:hypothetical protein
MQSMRKRYRVLLLAAIVAAFIVPVGFALSLESGAAAPRIRYGAPVPVTHAVVSAPALIAAPPAAAPAIPNVIPDGAKLFVAGTVLVGLAAIFRRAI